jgi:hypothetical protein
MPHAFGTAIRRNIDPHALGKAIAQPGLDQRYWCSQAIVATVDTETGEIDPTDNHAIYCDSAGVDVDVELQPLGQPCTCKYAGISAGDVTIYAPIRPGDLVLAECPDGDLTTPVITHIFHSRSRRQPVSGGKPIFDNNRLLVYAKNVPIDIRNAGGVQVLIEQDGTVTTTAKAIKQGSTNAANHAVLGDTYTTQWQEFLTGLQAYIAGIKAVADPSNASTPPFAAILTQLQGETFVSPKVTLE